METTKTLQVVLTDYRTQPSLETYFNNFCNSLPSVETTKTLRVVLTDYRKESNTVTDPPDWNQWLNNLLEDLDIPSDDNLSSLLKDIPSDDNLSSLLEDIPSDDNLSSLLEDISPDEWAEVLKDVKDSSSFDLDTLVPPEDLVHMEDMSPDEGVDLMYDLVS